MRLKAQLNFQTFRSNCLELCQRNFSAAQNGSVIDVLWLYEQRGWIHGLTGRNICALDYRSFLSHRAPFQTKADCNSTNHELFIWNETNSLGERKPRHRADVKVLRRVHQVKRYTWIAIHSRQQTEQMRQDLLDYFSRFVLLFLLDSCTKHLQECWKISCCNEHWPRNSELKWCEEILRSRMSLRLNCFQVPFPSVLVCPGVDKEKFLVDRRCLVDECVTLDAV